MIRLIQVPALEKCLEHQNHRSEFRVFLLKEFDELNAVYTVGSVEGNVDLNVGFSVL